MQKVSAGRSPGRSVDTELETLRLLAMQRRKVSLRLFLKRNTQLQAVDDKAATRAMVADSASKRRSAQVRLG
ncbi:MAG TPA: hypothetical protein VFT77_14505 [Reyranella sp.]|nr:hypothetical protein [Reyranella sp.]